MLSGSRIIMVREFEPASNDTYYYYLIFYFFN